MASEAFEDVVETFAFLDDWEDRYTHIIDMGKEMHPLDDGLKTAQTKVDGCASQVWIVPEIDGTGDVARIRFDGDSDAMIVRGLIALLRKLYSGRTAAEILQTDARAEFARLGLDKHLSSQRSNGLTAMISRIRTVAEAA